MNDVNGETPKPAAAISKLGRGLGRLIPIQKPAEPASAVAVPVATSSASTTGSTAPLDGAKIVAAKPPQESTRLPLKAVSAAVQARSAFAVTQPKETDPAFGRLVLQLPVGAIRPNARQPRKDFDPNSIAELANSIRSAGLLQPIVVRPVIGEKSSYELIAGERRLRACKQLGWSDVPAIVMNATDQNAGIWALIENVHRSDLNPMDRALSLKELATEFKLTHEALAEQVGLDRSSVTNLLRLAEIDETTAGLVRKGLISQGHAKALLAVANLKTRTTLAESTVRGEWSVRALEREVQRVSEVPKADVPRGTSASRRRSNIDALERKLSQALGTDVSIQTGRKPNTGKLQISFYSLEQFEGIVSALGLKSNQLSLDE